MTILYKSNWELYSSDDSSFRLIIFLMKWNIVKNKVAFEESEVMFIKSVQLNPLFIYGMIS